jgi:hypothetical protein
VKFIQKPVLFLLAALLFAGCTMSFTYNHLDWLIPWYVDGYVDLTREQRQILKLQLEPRLQWHREEELERYIAILDRIESDMAGPVSAQMVQDWVDEVITAGKRVEESMLSVALEFAAGVSDAQMEEFTESLWEEQREFEEDMLDLSDEEYRQDSFKNLEELLEQFLGRLLPAQGDILRTAANAMRRIDGVWLEERTAWLTMLAPLLQRPPGWQQAITAAYWDREQNRTPQYREIMDHNTAVVTQAIADVAQLMSGRQRKHTVREIDDLRQTLRELADR